MLDEFTAEVPQSSFGNPASISFPKIQTYIQKYQDPRQADTIMRVQQELDETKIVLVSFVRWVFCLIGMTVYCSIRQSSLFSSVERS